jgi:hypothetical protein
MWGSRGNDADTLLEKSFEVIHSRMSKRFFRRVAEISTEHLSPKIQSGIHSEHFSTYPQRSSQQQALYIFVLLKILCNDSCGCEKAFAENLQAAALAQQQIPQQSPHFHRPFPRSALYT